MSIHRALIILSPLADKAEELHKYIETVTPAVRASSGLVKFEASTDEEGNCYLYYQWASRAEEKAYVESERYRQITGPLREFIATAQRKQLNGIA